MTRHAASPCDLFSPDPSEAIAIRLIPMADFRSRVPQSVQGKYYVDETCIYCDLCRATAPTVFRYEKESGWASVFHQPVTPEELRLAIEAIEGCPTASIGDDGEQHDWSTSITSR